MDIYFCVLKFKHHEITVKITVKIFKIFISSERASRISSFKSTGRKSLKQNFEQFQRSFKGSLKKKRTLESATMSNLKRATPEEREHLLSHFEAAEYFSMLASAISGGVESPIQFITQVNINPFPQTIIA